MIFLDAVVLYIKEGISLLGVLTILIAAIRSLYQLCLSVKYKTITSNYIRLQFGDSVILGLEFMVGADIIGSLVQPDYYNLGMLAILVLIRTVLSYFLNLELIALTPKQQHALK